MATMDYCSWSKASCDCQIKQNAKKVFCIYPSERSLIAETIRAAVSKVNGGTVKQVWTWQDIPSSGRIIFCDICAAIRAADIVIADVSTFNFNVMFEMGYAIALNKVLMPIREKQYTRDRSFFDDLGIFDVIGYKEFENSDELTQIIKQNMTAQPLRLPVTSMSEIEPTYIVKSPTNTDAQTRIIAAMTRSALYRFRTYDKNEVSRLSLFDAYRQVCASFGVIVHMIDNNRDSANVHNALCAFISGLSTALGRRTLMLQEGTFKQPIDYRDIVVPYVDTKDVNRAIENFVKEVADALYYAPRKTEQNLNLLERIDLGDTTAENEIVELENYFIKTPPFLQASKGHARLIIGRKGSGKTAIFYALKNSIRGNNSLVVDLKPDGHHFTKLREQVLDHLKEGVQLHTLTCFWNYLLLLELARKLIDCRSYTAYQDEESLSTFKKLKHEYDEHCLDVEGDFSERIMALIDSITHAFTGADNGILHSSNITALVYKRDISALQSLVLTLLSEKEVVWLLFDNLDKGWTTTGATEADIAVVRSLLDATRKIQRELSKSNTSFHSVVFLRNDIYDLLTNKTSDRGKESVVSLDWSDESLLQEMLKKRMGRTKELTGDFRMIWTKVFPPHIGAEDSFRYILKRSFNQPRALLNFVTKSINAAIGHGHQHVTENDILLAERAFSEDMLSGIRFEIRDIYPKLDDLLYSFVGFQKILTVDDISLVVSQSSAPLSPVDKLIDVLLWFGFIGVWLNGEAKFSPDLGYDMQKLKGYIQGIDPSERRYCIHPAFHLALEL